MSSEARASSAVRNLRSLFENKASLDSNSPDSRGRSPGGIGGSDKENGYRPRSKVRASFIPVDGAGGMATVERQGSSGQRRGSFSEMDGDGALSDLKRTISEQQKMHLVPEGALESAAATPLKKPGEGQLGHDVPAENPDKPVTGEQESSELKPADPTSEGAVSGGDALPPVAEDLRAAKTTAKKTETKKPTINGKPAAISTKASSKATSSTLKSPASQPKTPTSAKVSGSSTNAASTASPSLKAPLKKPSRSSLTAPTAASLARAGAGSDKPSSTKTSPTSRPKAREVTKPIDLPSHLTAPTASSKAKHDADSAPSSSTTRTTTTSRPKATTSAKAAPRASLGARPASRDSNPPSRKSNAASNGSFLERMMKPTTASANHQAHRVEVKGSPKSTAAAPAAKPKVNGTKSAPKSTARAPTKPSTHSSASALEAGNEVHGKSGSEESVGSSRNNTVAPVPSASIAEEETQTEDPETGEEEKAMPHEIEGTATPNGETGPEANLEATPAAMNSEETIR